MSAANARRGSALGGDALNPTPANVAIAAPAFSRLSGTHLERAGDYNQRVVLQAIRVRGPITRTELAEISGLTAPAIANITRRLMQDGLIADAGQRRGGRGQPATRFAVHPDARLSLGVNIDRDHVTVVVLDLLTEPLMAVSWLVNPAAILLGGRMPAARLDDLAARITRRLSGEGKETPGQTPVLRAVTAEDAPAIGAAILPFLQHLLPSHANLMKTGAV